MTPVPSVANSKRVVEEKMEHCRKIVTAVFLACEETVAEDISQSVAWLIARVEHLLEFERDRLDDWRRIQDAERRVAKLEEVLSRVLTSKVMKQELEQVLNGK